MPLACIISPLISGQIADKWLNAEWILAGAHLIGAVLLLIAAVQTRFAVLFVVMFLYSIFYAATLPLVNAVLFANVTDAAWQGKVFMWAPIAWAIAGYFLTGWRWMFKTAEKGRDCLFLAAALSVIMAACCLAFARDAACGGGRDADFEGDDYAAEHQFSGLYDCLACGRWADAVLFFGQRTIYDGHGHSRQERAGCDGYCPGGAGRSHILPA